MGETQNDSNSGEEGVKPKRWKRGDIHPENGMLFWQYQKGCVNNEWWVNPETFADYRDSCRKRAVASLIVKTGGQSAKNQVKRQISMAREKVFPDGDPTKKWKRGDPHPTDEVFFWEYNKGSTNGEQWVDRETLDDYRDSRRRRELARHHKHRDEINARNRDKLKERKEKNTLDPNFKKTKWRRGDTNPETGLKVWNIPSAGNPEGYWVTEEKFEQLRAKYKKTSVKWRAQNIDRIKEREKARYLADHEANKKKRRDYYASVKHLDSVKEGFKKYREENRDSRNRAIKEWNAANKLKIRSWKKNKYHNDPLFACAHSLRGRMAEALRRGGFRKNSSISDILGCSWCDFKAHIESKFVEGMGWTNRGRWHLDHIIPLSSAKTEEAMLLLGHYTNIQPLWAEDNLAKRDKMPSGV